MLYTRPEDTVRLAVAATMQSGFIYISSIVVSPRNTAYPQHRAKLQYAGLALSFAGIAASAFVKDARHLLPTIGLAYPLGACMLYMPAATLSLSLPVVG